MYNGFLVIFAYIDPSTGLFRFQGVWNWTDGKWDALYDIEDYAAVRMTNTTGYQIYSSFAKTFDEAGNQTGYVNNYGNHSPSNSKVTKRFEDLSGVVYNLIDINYYVGTGPYLYQTDSGIITQYIKKTTGGYNKIFLDFHHNYKKYSWNTTASVNNVGLNGAGYALTVSYSHSNHTWQRTSGGKTLN